MKKNTNVKLTKHISKNETKNIKNYGNNNRINGTI